MAMPFFSIIIPTYNRAALLKKLLNSLVTQSFKDFELLVIDDGGADNTEEIVASYADTRFHYFKKTNGGVSSARNYGISKAKGRYINFFDSDDFAYPNHLYEAHKFFILNPTKAVAIFDYDWGEAEKKTYSKISNKYTNPNIAILSKNYISTNCIFIEQSLTNSLKFNETLRISEDWDYWIRLSSRTTFFLINIPTSYIVEHDQRGLKNINLDDLIAQKDQFITSLREDKYVMTMPNFSLKIIIAHFCSLIALNAALVDRKRIAINYFIKSILLHPKSLINKRSFAIIKHLLFTW
jgi:glycosyltransferase involved in cell wall biosynthesis